MSSHRTALTDGIGFALCGVLLLLSGLWQIWQAHQTASWPAVKGRVLASVVELDNGRAGAKPDGGATYAGAVQYQYKVNGKLYRNDVVRIGQISTWSQNRALETARRHPRGPAQVFYAPADPTISVLELGLPGDIFLVPGVGLAFTLVGLLIFRNRPKPFITRADVPIPEQKSETDT